MFPPSNLLLFECLINVPVRVFISKKMPHYTHYGVYSALYDIKFMCLYWPVNFLEKQAGHRINKSRQQNFKRIMSTGNFTATMSQCQRRLPGTLPKELWAHGHISAGLCWRNLDGLSWNLSVCGLWECDSLSHSHSPHSRSNLFLLKCLFFVRGVEQWWGSCSGGGGGGAVHSA